MLYQHYTEKLIGLQEANIEETEEKLRIHIELPRKPHTCPCCQRETDKVHDYRKQELKDVTAFGKSVCIIYKKRRYRCVSCGKRFFENNTFLSRYQYHARKLRLALERSNAWIRTFLRVAESF